MSQDIEIPSRLWPWPMTYTYVWEEVQLHEYTSVGLVVSYSLVGTSSSWWPGMFIVAGILLWLDEKCFNLILSRGGRHMFSNTNPEREEAGPWHRNQAGDYLEPDILQIIFSIVRTESCITNSWLWAITPADQLMLTLLILKNVSGQYVFDLWAPLIVRFPIVHHVESRLGIVRSLSLWLSSVNVWTSLYFGENFHPATDQLRSGLREEC